MRISSEGSGRRTAWPEAIDALEREALRRLAELPAWARLDGPRSKELVSRLAELRERAEQAGSDVFARLGTLPAGVLGRLGLATNRDLAELTARIGALDERLKRVGRRRQGQGPKASRGPSIGVGPLP
ncbi:hypothetical protein [Vulgatibacter incomptus]|nr:hypothetical protein [Vulgatibacter incomptus]